jgi:hypothetical protein
MPNLAVLRCVFLGNPSFGPRTEGLLDLTHKQLPRLTDLNLRRVCGAPMPYPVCTLDTRLAAQLRHLTFYDSAVGGLFMKTTPVQHFPELRELKLSGVWPLRDCQAPKLQRVMLAADCQPCLIANSKWAERLEKKRLTSRRFDQLWNSPMPVENKPVLILEERGYSEGYRVCACGYRQHLADLCHTCGDSGFAADLTEPCYECNKNLPITDD